MVSKMNFHPVKEAITLFVNFSNSFATQLLTLLFVQILTLSIVLLYTPTVFLLGLYQIRLC